MVRCLLKRLRQSPALVPFLVILLVELASVAWFSARSKSLYFNERLSLIAPPGAWKEIPVEPGQVGTVSFDRCRRYHFSPCSDVFMEILSLEFDPGHMAYEETLAHPIEVCTSYSGKEVLKEFPPASFRVGNQKMGVQSLLTKDAAGRPGFVFKAVWLHNAYPSGSDQLSHRDRISLAFQRWMPGPPALTVIASISGVPDYEKALEIFEANCLQHITKSHG